MKKVRFVGLAKDVWLPDDIEVVIDIVPSWRSNIRSNQIFAAQTKETWHDTGNPNSDAWGERNWLHSGAGGAYVGYNFAYDGKRIIQLTPLNEVTWAAGTTEGNRYSWHAEQCLNTNWDACLRVGAALHGGLAAAMGFNIDKALVQHNVWYGKHCPAQIRNRGLWGTVVNMTKKFYKEALAASLGQVIDDVLGGGESDVVVSPRAIILEDGTKWDGTSDVTVNTKTYYSDPKTVTSLGVNVRMWATTTAPLLRTSVAAGDTFDVLGWCHGEMVDGEDRWWISKYYSRVWVGGTEEKPTEAKGPEPTPEDDVTEDDVIVSEGGALIVRGLVYYPVGGTTMVTVNEDADLYQYANFGTKKVGTVKAGDEVEVELWCQGQERDGETLWWILHNPEEGANSIKTGARLHVTFTDARPS